VEQSVQTLEIKNLGKVRVFNARKDYEFDQAIDHYEKGLIVFLKDVVTLQQWNTFIRKTTRTGIVVLQSIPPKWHRPNRISVVRYHNHMFDVLADAVQYSKENMQYQRQVDNFESKGFCMVGAEYERCNFVQVLYALGLHRTLELYHPNFIRTQLREDFFSINDLIRSCEDNSLQPHHRFDFRKNLNVVKDRMIKNDLVICLNNRFLDSPSAVSEKTLYGAIFGIPCLQVMSQDLRDLMQDYGFQFLYPSGLDLIKSSMEWISLFCQLSDYQRQKFQEQQGETAIQNQKALFNLENLLIQYLEDDLSRL